MQQGRGGVPICFPQFSDFGPLGQHGFARNSDFTVLESGKCSVTMLLTYDGTAHAAFPHPFTLKITTALQDSQLLQTLEARNTGTSPMPFTAALHTYLRVQHISGASVEGLIGVPYLDSLQGRVEKMESEPSVVFTEEVDRIYLNAPNFLKVIDNIGNRTFEICKGGFPDAVVWNPWIAKAKGMGDFGDEEYKEMVCVEPAIAASGPLILEPGQKWVGTQRITVTQAGSTTVSGL